MFQRIDVTVFEDIFADDDTTEIAIRLGGLMYDDTWPAPVYVEHRIEGDEFAALPAADPATQDTPADPRYQACFVVAARAAMAQYAILAAHFASQPIATPQSLANIPTITPEVLAQFGVTV